MPSNGAIFPVFSAHSVTGPFVRVHTRNGRGVRAADVVIAELLPFLVGVGLDAGDGTDVVDGVDDAVQGLHGVFLLNMILMV